METAFVNAWRQLTQLVYEFEGSLGSRLHKQGDGSYIAYAQWPNKETWQDSGNKLPENAYEIRDNMKEACSSIETLFELNCIEDFLKFETFK